MTVTCLGSSAAAGPAEGQSKVTDIPVEGVVTNPDWVSKPTGDQLANVYPVVAQALNVSGRAAIECKVTAQGDATDCKVLAEAPMGMGFGAAAVSLAPYFKMRPQTVDGAPVGGAMVNIPIHFQLADTPAAQVLTSPVVASPSPAAVDLARRIVAASGNAPAVPAELAGWIATVERLQRMETPNSDAARAQRAALDALKASLAQAEPQFRDARAQAIAESFTGDELAKIAAFFDTPAGQAWASRLPSVDALEAKRTLAIVQSARAAAHERYCETGHCAVAPAKGPGGS
ncbi:MAG TPA: TonB family protein [Caulobacteraceae bacterium]|jgi:TonB family protein|nr:TonB family protein [Caulobacteraceae bacterium]